MRTRAHGNGRDLAEVDRRMGIDREPRAPFGRDSTGRLTISNIAGGARGEAQPTQSMWRDSSGKLRFSQPLQETPPPERSPFDTGSKPGPALGGAQDLKKLLAAATPEQLGELDPQIVAALIEDLARVGAGGDAAQRVVQSQRAAAARATLDRAAARVEVEDVRAALDRFGGRR